MKKFIFPIAFLLLALNLFSQLGQNEVTAMNITVPVRVLDGSRFVDNVTIEDFELYEDGTLQKIDALYLVQKTKIERKETPKEFNPNLSRNFYLLFQLTDWDPKLGEAIEYFFNNVFLPEDSLIIVTPQRNYNLSPEAFRNNTKEDSIKEMKKILRRDIKVGNSHYNSILRDLRRLVREIQSAAGLGRSTDTSVESGFQDQTMSLELLLPRYQLALQKMDELRFIDEKKFTSFAGVLKKQLNQKYVFLFYQREFRPEIHPTIASKMMVLFQDKPHILGELSDLFNTYSRQITFNKNRLTQTFADSSLLFNFLFSNKNPKEISGVYMREQSEDVFSAFSEVAEATGGIVDNSQNLLFGFKKAAEISESYYLLYYSPKNYVKDGKFKSIKIKVKNKDYKINYRQGYFAR